MTINIYGSHNNGSDGQQRRRSLVTQGHGYGLQLSDCTCTVPSLRHVQGSGFSYLPCPKKRVGKAPVATVAEVTIAWSRSRGIYQPCCRVSLHSLQRFIARKRHPCVGHHIGSRGQPNSFISAPFATFNRSGLRSGTQFAELQHHTAVVDDN